MSGAGGEERPPQRAVDDLADLAAPHADQVDDPADPAAPHADHVDDLATPAAPDHDESEKAAQAAGEPSRPPEPDAPLTASGALRVLAAGLSDAGRQRLREAGGVEIIEDVAAIGSVDAAVVSTRLPRAELRPLLASITDAADTPVVALAHTGGEGMAVEIMRAGGLGVLAEGNEAALRALIDGSPHDQSMVEVYDRQVSQSAAFDPMRGHDRATGLPGAGAFEQRAEDLATGGDMPRVMRLRVIGLRGPSGRLSGEATTLLRRRLAMSLRQLAAGYQAELYSLDDTDFGVVSARLPPARAEELAERMAALTETFAPLGNQVLGLAAGHAGPEASVERTPLTDLARRALEVAAGEKRSNVVTAERLALGVSSTTELEAVQHAVAFLERHAPYAEGHAQRVAEWSGEIAWQLGFEGQARTRVQLAALAHDVGLVGLPRECLADPGTLDGQVLEAYRAHSERGAAWMRPSAGPEVADAIRAHHERWDGSGFPDGLAGEEIPLAARVVCLADVFDRLLTGADPTVGEPLPVPAALVVIDERAGSELDPSVVEVAVPILDKLLSGRDT